MQTNLSDRPMTSAFDGQTEFQREVATRFGLLPNFFSSAPDAPEIIERLWAFAKAGYLDNPIPSLFKERLFVYLSRFCEVRYCIARHCAFLVGGVIRPGTLLSPSKASNRRSSFSRRRLLGTVITM